MTERLRLFRVRVARLPVLDDDGPPLPLFTLVDYVTADSPKDSLDVFRKASPTLAALQAQVEAEIPDTGLPEWIVMFPLDGGAEAVVCVASEESLIAQTLVTSCVDHPVLGPMASEGRFRVAWMVDRSARGAWA